MYPTSPDYVPLLLDVQLDRQVELLVYRADVDGFGGDKIRT